MLAETLEYGVTRYVFMNDGEVRAFMEGISYLADFDEIGYSIKRNSPLILTVYMTDIPEAWDRYLEDTDGGENP